MRNVIDVEYPISTTMLTKPFAFHNELLAAAFRMLLVPVKINPLEVRALVFTRDASLVIRVWLIVAF